MRSQMYNRRSRLYPQVPATLQNLTNALSTEANSSISSSIDDTDNLYGSSVNDTNGNHHIIFVTRRMLAFMTMCSILFSDGTFKSIPNIPGISQVFCITTIWRHHVLHLAWVLMSSLTQVAYIAVLTRLRVMMGAHRLERVITDFELAEQNAWRVVFHVHVQGCLFHYCSALLKNAFDLRLKCVIRDFENMRRIFSWCCALALLPNQFIDIGFFVIGFDAMHLYPVEYQRLREFFLYVNDTWVASRSRRPALSVSGSMNRTNNACETQNRWLLQEVGTPHPNIFLFLDGIARMEHSAYVDIIALRNGGNPSRHRRASHIANDVAITSLTEDLYNSPDGAEMAVRRFLHAAAYRLYGLIDRGLQ